MSPPATSAHWLVSLTTDRLVLRPVESPDAPAHVRLWTDPEVRRYLGGPVPEDVA